VARAVRDRGGPLGQQALTVALLLLNPLVFRTLSAGHPEELVASALCVATVLALMRNRVGLAGALLGAAVASKLWAILIAPAVLLSRADPRSALRLGIAAAAVVLVLYTPMAVGDSGRLRGTLASANHLGTVPGGMTAADVWWFVARQSRPFDAAVAVVDGRVVTQRDVGYRIRAGVAGVTHPLVVALAALLGLLWARSPERRRRPESLLLLFALIFLIRCVLDPGDWSYYHVASVTSLVAYEGIACRRPPWASLFLIAWLESTSWLSPRIHTDADFGLYYLAWALPTIAGLAAWLFKSQPLGEGRRSASWWDGQMMGPVGD
jgi:hypothetical protein